MNKSRTYQHPGKVSLEFAMICLHDGRIIGGNSNNILSSPNLHFVHCFPCDSIAPITCHILKSQDDRMVINFNCYWSIETPSKEILPSIKKQSKPLTTFQPVYILLLNLSIFTVKKVVWQDISGRCFVWWVNNVEKEVEEWILCSKKGYVGMNKPSRKNSQKLI